MTTVAARIDWEPGALESGRMKRALLRSLRKAGSTALRDMRAEANKRIRQRKRIKVARIRKALTLVRPKGANINALAWALEVSGEPVPLTAYPHRRTKKGVSVEVNRGKRTLIKSAFIATMKRSGHKGVFLRRGLKRLPIDEQLGSRPLDALSHKGEADAVLKRGQRVFNTTFHRVFPLETEGKLG